MHTQAWAIFCPHSRFGLHDWSFRFKWKYHNACIHIERGNWTCNAQKRWEHTKLTHKWISDIGNLPTHHQHRACNIYSLVLLGYKRYRPVMWIPCRSHVFGRLWWPGCGLAPEWRMDAESLEAFSRVLYAGSKRLRSFSLWIMCSSGECRLFFIYVCSWVPANHVESDAKTGFCCANGGSLGNASLTKFCSDSFAWWWKRISLLTKPFLVRRLHYLSSCTWILYLLFIYRPLSFHFLKMCFSSYLKTETSICHALGELIVLVVRVCLFQQAFLNTR
jgi:hypothetical protein